VNENGRAVAQTDAPHSTETLQGQTVERVANIGHFARSAQHEKFVFIAVELVFPPEIGAATFRE
jgi:hypothetical protein